MKKLGQSWDIGQNWDGTVKKNTLSESVRICPNLMSESLNEKSGQDWDNSDMSGQTCEKS